jgi:hypothetical protein
MIVPFGTDEAITALGARAMYIRNTPGSLERVFVSAVNRAAAKAKGKAIQILTQKYWAKSRSFAKRFSIWKAENLTRGAVLRARGEPITLSSFKTVQVNVPHANGRVYKGVKVAVLRKNQPKFMKGPVFLAPGSDVHNLVYERGSKRENLTVLSGPEGINFLDEPEIESVLKEYVSSIMDTLIAEEAEKELKRLELLVD